MRISRYGAIGLLAAVMTAVSVGAEQAPPVAGEDAAGCVDACDEAHAECTGRAEAAVKACVDRASEPCKDWCPCTQYIGAAYHACTLECARCEEEAEEIAAGCPNPEAIAACNDERRRCVERCP